jgi:hypothetical protein
LWEDHVIVNLSCGSCKAIQSFSGDPLKCGVCGWVCVVDKTAAKPYQVMPPPTGEPAGGLIEVALKTLQERFSLQMLPMPVCARRMAVLFFLVCVIDVVASFLTAKPQLWCALIPVLIPLFAPAAIFSRSATSRSE